MLSIKNISKSLLTGRIFLVLDSLTRSVVLVNANGMVRAHIPIGSPYVQIRSISPHKSITVKLRFKAPKNAHISFGTRLLKGDGIL